jgi:hypothetical protein
VNTRTVRLSRFSAAVCATVISAISAWAFVDSTACSERDPFRFASIMQTNANLRVAHAAVLLGQPLPGTLPHYDLLAPSPLCPGRCV